MPAEGRARFLNKTSKQMKEKKLTLRLGGVVIRFVSYSPEIEFKRVPEQSQFVSKTKPEITISVHPGPIPKYPLGEKVFSSRGAWDLHRNKGRWVFRVGWRRGNNSLAKLAVFDENFKSGQIYLNSSKPTWFDLLNSYLGYPLGHLILSSFLFINGDAVLHACGINDRGKGIIFVGPSGRGKTTMASLWLKRKGALLLADERVALRKTDGKFYIFGIPRYGYGKGHLSSPGKAPLERIFFLERGQKNCVYPLTKHRALSNLLITAFPPVWSPRGMKDVLEIFAEIAKKVPSSKLIFAPDRSAVDFVRKIG